MNADAVSEEGIAPRLVERDPILAPVAEGSKADLGVVREPPRPVRGRPAASIVECLRIIPVEQGDIPVNVLSCKFVDQPVIEVDPRLVNPPRAVRQNPGPG